MSFEYPDPLFFPSPFPLDPFQYIHERNKYRYFNQRPDGTRKRLVATCTIYSHCHGNGKFEVVASACETLCAACLVAEAQFLTDKSGCRKHDQKVDHKRCSDPKNGGNGMNHMFSLRCKEHNDGIDETDERQWSDETDKVCLISSLADQGSKYQTSNDCGSERYACIQIRSCQSLASRSLPRKTATLTATVE